MSEFNASFALNTVSDKYTKTSSTTYVAPDVSFNDGAVITAQTLRLWTGNIGSVSNITKLYSAADWQSKGADEWIGWYSGYDNNDQGIGFEATDITYLSGSHQSEGTWVSYIAADTNETALGMDLSWFNTNILTTLGTTFADVDNYDIGRWVADADRDGTYEQKGSLLKFFDGARDINGGGTSLGAVYYDEISSEIMLYSPSVATLGIFDLDNATLLTVTDAATVAQANSVVTATTGTVQFSGGITDSADALGADGNLTSGYNAARADDSDVNVIINDTPTIAELNAIAGGTTGTTTAALSGNKADLVTLTTAGTDAITMTVTDAVTVAEFSTLDGKTSTNVILQGGISDTAANLAPSGTASSGLTNSTTQDGDVAITITGTAPTVAELNKIASLTTGVVTASISGNKTTLAGLNTASDDAITMTVTDAVTVAEFNTLDGKTSVGVILTGGVSDAAAAYAATNGTATSGRNAIAAQDGDAALTVTDAATAAQANSVATATTGTVQFSGGITDSADALGADGNLTSGYNAARADDSDVNVIINDISYAALLVTIKSLLAMVRIRFMVMVDLISTLS